MNLDRGDVFVISAPSGSGKTTICRSLVAGVEGLALSVSFTTRGKKAGEIEGADYHFVDEPMFDKMIRSNEFLEYASVYGKRYGTSRSVVRDIVSSGKDAILEIDVQGGRKVKTAIPEAVLVGIVPPDWKTLRMRLFDRGRDSREEMAARMSAAAEEMRGLLSYDYLVVNDHLGEAVRRVEWIIRAARLRRDRQCGRLETMLAEAGKDMRWRE